LIISNLQDTLYLLIALLCILMAYLPATCLVFFDGLFKNPSKRTKFVKLRIRIFKIYSLIIFIVLIIILLIILTSDNQKYNYVPGHKVFASYIVFQFVLGYIMFLPFVRARRLTVVRTVLNLAISLLVFSLVFAYLNADLTANGRVTNEISEIEFKGEIIRPDRNQFFIGKTNNYLFMYNKTEEKVTIYSMSDVSKIILD